MRHLKISSVPSVDSGPYCLYITVSNVILDFLVLFVLFILSSNTMESCDPNKYNLVLYYFIKAKKADSVSVNMVSLLSLTSMCVLLVEAMEACNVINSAT